MKTWIGMFLSPAGAVKAAKTWSPPAAYGIGILITSLVLTASFMPALSNIAEPYNSTAEVFEQVYPAIMGGLLMFPTFLYLLAGVAWLDKAVWSSPMYKGACLASAPLLIPFWIWSFFGIAQMASDPQVNMRIDKTEWVHESYVQILGSGWMWLALVAYGITSLFYCVAKTKQKSIGSMSSYSTRS